ARGCCIVAFVALQCSLFGLPATMQRCNKGPVFHTHQAAPLVGLEDSTHPTPDSLSGFVYQGVTGGGLGSTHSSDRLTLPVFLPSASPHPANRRITKSRILPR